MNAAAIFRGTYADWKLIRTRSVVQVVFEIPLAEHDAAYAALGGMPDPAKERWFGIARLDPKATKEAPHEVAPPDATPRPPVIDETSNSNALRSPLSGKQADGERRKFDDLPPAQQCGIRCTEMAFWRFLNEQYNLGSRGNVQDSDRAAEVVRWVLSVQSRADLNLPEHTYRWNLMESSYRAWLQEPAHV